MNLSKSCLRSINSCTATLLPRCASHGSKYRGSFVSSNQVRYQSSNIFKEGDIVLLEQLGPRHAPILSKPLVLDRSIFLNGDSIATSSIIGKGVGEIARSKRGKRELRLQQPTLAQYCDLSPRIVTPIYSQDASLIVSLLDLHPTQAPNDEPPPEFQQESQSENDLLLEEAIGKAEVAAEEESRLEIFEAGTGHGSLTLHLARAIHAANPHPPKSPRQYNSFLEKRRAIVQTLDISPKHSDHAKKVVGNYRRGVYSHCVDFHVGTIPDYIDARLASSNGSPVFDHAILDLPDTHDYLEIVGKSLKLGGTLITFNPSLSQIMRCVEDVRSKKLPFVLDKVLEIGLAAGVGGREWDVRLVKQRVLKKKEDAAVLYEGTRHLVLDSSIKAESETAQFSDVAFKDNVAFVESGDIGESHVIEDTAVTKELLAVEDNAAVQGNLDEPAKTEEPVADLATETTASMGREVEALTNDSEDGMSMICRPKVGVRIEGGGFIGVWKRWYE